MSDKFNLQEITKRLQAGERETLALLSNQAQNYFLSSFKNQGFDGKPWQEVQRRIPGTNAWKYPKPTSKKSNGIQRRTSPILVGAGLKIRGGTLRRAVSSMADTAQITTSGGGGTSKLRMVVDLDYAKYNNEGGGHLPKRQFVGQTAQLTEMQLAKIKEITKRIFK